MSISQLIEDRLNMKSKRSKSNLNLKVHIIEIYVDRTTRVGY